MYFPSYLKDIHLLPSNLGKVFDEAEKQDVIIIHLFFQFFMPLAYILPFVIFSLLLTQKL